MEDYDDSKDFDPSYDDYEEEIEANGHDLDEEDIDQENMEDALYKSDDEELPPSEDEHVDEDFLGIEKEQDDIIVPEEPEKPKKKETVVSKVVPPNKRRTFPVMTKFEHSNFISWRAIMIEHNSPLMIPDTKFVSAIDIAREETEKGVNPLIIQRNLPNGTVEEWKCSELSLPKTYV